MPHRMCMLHRECLSIIQSAAEIKLEPTIQRYGDNYFVQGFTGLGAKTTRHHKRVTCVLVPLFMPLLAPGFDSHGPPPLGARGRFAWPPLL